MMVYCQRVNAKLGDTMEQIAIDAWKFAVNNLKRSYSPYSCFQVGSCLVDHESKLYFGCNVENASYGATICAERVAFFKAVSEGSRKFQMILVLTDTEKPTPPCALCLQVMAEFCPPDFKIVLSNLQGIQASYTFKELLSFPFGPSYLLTEEQ